MKHQTLPNPPRPSESIGTPWRGRYLILGLLIAAIVLQVSTGMLLKSPTFDEPRYLGLGLYLAQHHRWDIPDSISHPPLTYYLHSLPLLFLKIPQTVWSEPTSVQRGRAILRLLPNDLVIRLARLPILVLSLVLAFYVYLWASQLYGNNAGLLALFLYAANPTVLAFSGIINADIPITAFSFITLYHLWRFCKTRSPVHLGCTGVGFGLALLSKYNALMLLPMLALLAPFCYASRRTNETLRTTVSSFLFILLLGCLILWAGYGFEWGFATSPSTRPHRILDTLFSAHEGLRQVAYQISEHIPIPVPSFIKGTSLLLLISKTWGEIFPEGSNICFLMGQYSQHGWWYYYLFSFLIKTPIGLILLIGLSLVFFRRLCSPYYLDESFLLIPPLFFVTYFSFFSEIQIGLRYILPAFPFLFVLSGRTANLPKVMQRRIAQTVILLLVLWHSVSTVSIHPNHLAYFNELVGGPGNGYRYLADSNLDWGQDLNGLKRYMDENGISKIKLSYFGTAEPEYYGIDYDYLPSSMVELGWSSLARSSAPDRPALPTKGTIAISVTELQALYFVDKGIYAWLKVHEPVAKIGYSIFVYRIE